MKAKLEYLEVALSKILIIDERIQENIVGKERKKYRANEHETDFYHYFRQQGIMIPLIPVCDVEDHRNCDDAAHIDCADLNNTSFGKMETKGTPAFDLARFIEMHLDDSRFCVIHLGLLEKMLGENETKNSVAIHGLIEKLFNGRKGFEEKLIITSGRGTPDNLPEKVRYPFVPLAPIQNAVETVFDKYVLAKLLYNSRRTT
ncbi:hypothetical protein [Leptolyngbya sp. 7M]|uniref:hypothetical protein n=1 Tax=Leptolyngbya sp. 7M TaxID=2812896 RepID=UPI001B8B34FD|nr:hypothetical protein [Leptolyngbya sp. 7M]QYO65284.1 hypothetical protein JVX88_00420 [Leptolyngbya sp. 7M]